MTATNEAVLMIEPLPCRCMYGIASLQQRKTEVRLTSCTRRQASRPVVRIESSSAGEMPALLKATSTEPNASWAAAKARATSAASLTSALTNRPPICSAAAWPASWSRSTTTTLAPSDANRAPVASPMPLPPPVTTAVRPSSLPAMQILLVCSGLFWCCDSDAFEVAAQFPVGHRGRVGGDLHLRHVRVVVDHVLAEGLGRQW